MKNSAHIIILNNKNQVLVVRRSSNDEWEPNKLALPGGGLEPNETLIQGIQRETMEEVNLTLDPKKIIHLSDISSKLKHCFFATNYFSGEVRLKDGEHSGFAWRTLEELNDSDSVPNLRMEIQAAYNVINGLKIKIGAK